jgi:hypothetical protein
MKRANVVLSATLLLAIVGVIVWMATERATPESHAARASEDEAREDPTRRDRSNVDDPVAPHARATTEDARRQSPFGHDGDVDRREDTGGARDGSTAPLAGSDEELVTIPARELDRLRRELVELREEQLELLGKPRPMPADIAPRHTKAALSGAVINAMGQANVPGGLDDVDCSEYPCIVFGRLHGDEEEMEEVERAAALQPYDGDVLTLLFWATSTDELDAPGPRETGLFALAFYTFEDRAESGADLDRRIRARTIEF